MSLSMGRKLKIRGMVYVAGEPIPFFWPMRTFVHHNPLHGLEHLPFPDAVERGSRLFHGRAFLARRLYQRYLATDKVDRSVLAADIEEFLAQREGVPGVDLHRWLMALLTETETAAAPSLTLAGVEDIRAALNGGELAGPEVDLALLATRLRAELLDDRPVYEAVDALYGTEIGAELDALVIKSCLDFFDEGQSVWSMPVRELGFFAAWRELARRSARMFVRGSHLSGLLADEDTPEGVIARVMEALRIPEDQWVPCFTRELARLHGWAGFIRWRANATQYYWQQRFPADLVDFLAVRLALAYALLGEHGRKGIPATGADIETALTDRTREMYLRHELHGGQILPALAPRVEQALALNRPDRIDRAFGDSTRAKCHHEAELQATRLRELAHRAGDGDGVLDSLSSESLDTLIQTLREFEDEEGMIWLRAMEAHATQRLLQGVNLGPPPARQKRPFAQALFCIDTRSERIRRHLESVGDYQSFGIAGFFGIPISFMELGKGGEIYLCPVLLKPKNLVLEMAISRSTDTAAVTKLEKALHELKESVLSPYFTVEAIGMLFGFDMVGKTLMPRAYSRVRSRLHEAKPNTHLLLDKLDREQADSIVRAVQRSMVAKAVEQEFELPPERITDNMVRELREAALGNAPPATELTEALGLDEATEGAFIQRLRETYRIDPAFARLQMEQLGRIGFTLEEQTGLVSQALRSIGLSQNFSRFILLVGHGSTSDNNPYESALDCGACGGSNGLVNARALAQMANKPEVRRRLQQQGIDIADDAWFIPALHDTTTDEIQLYDLDRLPSSHVVYLDRLRDGLIRASRLCAQERVPELQIHPNPQDPTAANREAQRNALDWSQVRPEWGLSGNAYFIIGRRRLTLNLSLRGRSFLHSYDYRIDPRRRLLENILTGPLVVAQWINMEHYFSTVDNERFGSGSKVYHNVAGRFGVMTGNLSDLRTGLPSQTVLENGVPYHQPLRLITVIEAPFDHAVQAIEGVVAIKNLVRNGWIRLVVLDPEVEIAHVYEESGWTQRSLAAVDPIDQLEEPNTS